MTTRTIDFHIRQDDIMRGHQCHPHACPAYRSIKRKLQEMAPLQNVSVSVHPTYVRIDSTIVSVPEQLTRFIRMFDTGKRVGELHFVLNIPRMIVN